MVGHPQGDELADFSAGKLDEDALTRIEGHLTGCAQCRERLKSLPIDRLTMLLRASPGELDRSADAGRLDDELPAGLGRHPRYRVGSEVGRGGMGIVYKAEHRLMKRVVALKVISPRLTGNRTAVARFRREVEAVAKLSHANIAAAYDADDVDGHLVLVEEFIEGTDLAQVVKEQGPLPVARACNYVRQAALALQHAHERGILHRDIKPSNLIVTGDGQVKVLDFGLASLRDQPGEEDHTDPVISSTPPNPALTDFGQGMGTADFVAPEQVRDAHAADARSDIFSLGRTLVFLLTGRSEAPLPASVPSALVGIFDKMTAPDPEKRFRAMSEVAAALTPFADEGKGRRVNRRMGAIGLLAVAMLLLLGGTLFLAKLKETIRVRLEGVKAATSEATTPRKANKYPASTTAYYRFEEGTGTKVVNSVDGSAEGTHNASYAKDPPAMVIPLTQEENRGALEFKGQQFATIGTKFLFQRGSGDGTLEFWVKRLEECDGILVWSSTSSDNNCFNIYVAEGCLRCNYRDPSGLLHVLLDSEDMKISVKVWTHVAITRSGDTYRFYKNGIPVYTVADGNPILPTMTGWSIGGPNRGEFKGLIDEVRISNKALSPGEFLIASPKKEPGNPSTRVGDLP